MVHLSCFPLSHSLTLNLTLHISLSCLFLFLLMFSFTQIVWLQYLSTHAALSNFPVFIVREFSESIQSSPFRLLFVHSPLHASTIFCNNILTAHIHIQLVTSCKSYIPQVDWPTQLECFWGQHYFGLVKYNLEGHRNCVLLHLGYVYLSVHPT